MRSGRNWPFLLRILLKDGWTEEGLARALFTDRKRISDYLSGARVPDERTALDLGKVFRSHKRSGLELSPTSGPDIEPETETLAVAPPARGVYELLAPDGYRHFQSITASGLLAVDLSYHKSFEERDVVPGLRRWLDRGDIILRVLSSSDPTS